MTLRTQGTLELRYSRHADFEQLKGSPFPETFQGVTVVEGDRVMGMCGVVFSQPFRAFMDVAEGVNPRDHARMVLLASRELVKIMNGIDAPIFAVADPNQPTSNKFLEHVGFERLNDEVYRWTARH